MDERIKTLAAQKRRIEAKQAALVEKVRAMGDDLNRAFDGTEVYGRSGTVTLEQTGPDDYTYGYLCYREQELAVLFRSTEDDLADEHHGVPDDGRGFAIRSLAECKSRWLERVLNEETLASLLTDIADRLTEREGRVDRSLSALHAITEAESAKLDAEMTGSLETMGDDTLKRLWGEALDATHLHTADGLTRSSRFLEAVCATILRERGEPLPADESLAPLVKACIRCLAWPSKEVLADVRQFTGGLTSLCNGIGNLRTHFGTAHGSSSHLPSLDASYAMLTKNAAAAVAIFLLSCHTAGTEVPPVDVTAAGTP